MCVCYGLLLCFFLMRPQPPICTLTDTPFPYTTRFRSEGRETWGSAADDTASPAEADEPDGAGGLAQPLTLSAAADRLPGPAAPSGRVQAGPARLPSRNSDAAHWP